ncbi:hypothetical protein B2J93_4966 [Marssonina coronariae]|uniref:DUF1989 domain-containing protein n=1 Tax=Diplocarpon coronariae TaxID=2795749 RepID=A0A218ZHB3_9HELO|nr:hypothetical protein B2J93_4966 [Marssonina coronariae]
MAPITIPARHGVAVTLKTGQTIKVINTSGMQVVDTWAFTLSSFPPSPTSGIISQISTQHTRASLNKIIPRVGDGLYNNERVKMPTVVEETSVGAHDTMIVARDRQRYEKLGGDSEHRNCADNLVEGLRAMGLKAPQFTPSPFKLFMNIPIHDDHETISFESSTSKENEYVSLKAELDLIVALSACPQDILKINCGKPTDAHFEIS